MKALAALALLCAVALPGVAQWRDEKGATPPSDSMKSIDGLGAALFLTYNEPDFVRQWTDLPEGEAPNLRLAKKAKRGDAVTAVVVYSGCGDETRECNAKVDFKVLGPDGSVYGEQVGALGGSGRAKPGLLRLSPALMRITIEPKDALGRYTVLATFRDVDGKKELALRNSFVVTAGTWAFTDGEALGQWLTYYYRNPEPSRVIDVIEAAGRDGSLEHDAKASITGFVAGAVTKEPSLLEAMADRFPELTNTEQSVVILGIWYSAAPGSAQTLRRIAGRSPQWAKAIEGQLAKGTPVITHLDSLWGYFMATGDEAPVLHVISYLKPGLRVQAMARWSLSSNAEQHPRVMEICRAQLPLQPPDIAPVLKEVIAKSEGNLEKKVAR